MRSFVPAAAVALLVGAAHAPALAAQDAPDAAAEEAARAAAEAWLELVDAGNYAESWKEAGEMFRSSLTADAWNQRIASVRTQVGEVETREFAEAQQNTDPPNAPPGEYVVIMYTTTFANMASARETVITTKEGAAWRTVGYLIQPQGAGGG